MPKRTGIRGILIIGQVREFEKPCPDTSERPACQPSTRQWKMHGVISVEVDATMGEG